VRYVLTLGLAALGLACSNQPPSSFVSSEEYRLRASDRINRQDFDGAEFNATRALSIASPGKEAAKAADLLALVAYHRGHYEAAIAHYTTGIENDRQSGWRYLDRADCRILLTRSASPDRRSTLNRDAKADIAEGLRLDPSLKPKADQLIALLAPAP
jgi:tetratricopeptide (TPR) repeat protein